MWRGSLAIIALVTDWTISMILHLQRHKLLAYHLCDTEYSALIESSHGKNA